MNGKINLPNLRAKIKKMVKPSLRMSDIARQTGIQPATLSNFVNRGLEIDEDAARKIYDCLLEHAKGNADRRREAVAP